MILVDPKDRSGIHYINERALVFSENDLEDPQRIAVSLVSGTVIIVNKKDDGDGIAIPRAANGDYEKWTLKGYSTKIPDGRNAAHFIFARLSRSDRTALIVFSLNNYNIDGSISTFTTNEDGSVTESRSEASSDYYYVRIGYLSETDGLSDRVLTYDCGQLSVGYEIDEIRGSWSELFIPHYDNPANPKELTWIEAKSHMGVNGGVTMFVDNGSLDLPSLYDGLPIDWDTIYWELDENGKKLHLKAKVDEGALTLGGLLNVGEWADQVPVTDRIMVQKAGSEVWGSMDIANIGTASFENIEEYGEGNAFTSFLVSKGEEGEEKLYLTKDKTFAEKSDLEENYFTRDEASGLFVTLDDTVQIIQGVKFFSEGLYIGLSKIWQSQDDVIYLDANLVVRGGVTMYAQDNVDIPSFMESLLLDENTLKLDENGYLTVIGGAGGSIEHALTWSGRSTGSYDGKSAQNIYIPSKVSEFTNDSAFITQSALSGYATQSWVKNQGYALASALGNYLPITGGTITGSLTVNGDFYSGGKGDFSKHLACRGNLNISGESGVNTSINLYSYDQSGYQFSNRVYEDKALNIYYRSAAGVFTEVMKIGSDGLTKMTSYYAYPLSLKRTHTNGGAYIKFFAKNQEILSMSAGTDSLHRFSVWYQDVSQNIDKCVMWVDSNGNMLAYGGITMYSDERKKTILRHVELSLKEVADAPLIEHYYNNDAEKTTHVGSIAQYWAGLNDWFCKKDNDGYYTMEIQNAALASAISVARELSRFESDTDRRIRSLEEENKELRKEIEQLKTV